MRLSQRRPEAGFSLIDVLVTMALFTILAGIAVPSLTAVADELKLGQATREVERELQTARLKAVTSNRAIRVRFNCPAVGQYRMVELIGTPSAPVAADTAANRCQETAYPYPSADQNPLTRPNHDGPARRLPTNVSFGAVRTLEFWPDGSVHAQAAAEVPWQVIPPTGDGTVAITLTKGTKIGTIRVNGLGKITLQ
jgi:type II secretory pathway pseudopilin PulG